MVKIQETAERRQITILHCDIVNSTAIIDGQDPEDVLLIMESNLSNWTRIVEACRGIFAGYTATVFMPILVILLPERTLPPML